MATKTPTVSPNTKKPALRAEQQRLEADRLRKSQWKLTPIPPCSNSSCSCANGICAPNGRAPLPLGKIRSPAGKWEYPWYASWDLACEYFHGDTGEGPGASHQTGWTALVAKLIEQTGGGFC